MNELKTPYEWCLEGNMHLLELPEGNENIYMLVELSKEEFLDYIKDVKVKTNSTPRKPEKFLEYRKNSSSKPGKDDKFINVLI